MITLSPLLKRGGVACSITISNDLVYSTFLYKYFAKMVIVVSSSLDKTIIWLFSTLTLLLAVTNSQVNPSILSKSVVWLIDVGTFSESKMALARSSSFCSINWWLPTFVIWAPLYQLIKPVTITSWFSFKLIVSILPQVLSPRTTIWLPRLSMKLALDLEAISPLKYVNFILIIFDCIAFNISSSGNVSNSTTDGISLISPNSIFSIFCNSDNPLNKVYSAKMVTSWPT